MELKLALSTLRPWRRADAPALARHANDRRVWRNLRDRFPHPYRRDHAMEWILGTAGTTQYAIQVGGEAVGGIGYLIGADVYRRSAEIGFWLGHGCWGQGIMSEAVPALTRHAFEAHALTRIHAEVFEWNAASMRVLEKSGFRCEGRLRQAVTKDGRTIDARIYAILNEEVEGAELGT